jgi:AcrR family transcriptional regulator
MSVSEPSTHPRAERRRLRRDAEANRERLLAAAALAVRREGAGVPLATIAADAGVGVGTLYRRYPSREALLAALTKRSFERVLDAARRAAQSGDSGIDALGRFIDQTIEHGAELVLPLHGGPVPLDQEADTLRGEVRETLEHILSRGRADRTVRPEVTGFDIIVFGALLAQPLPHVADWKLVARRHAAIYLDGLALGAKRSPLPSSTAGPEAGAPATSVLAGSAARNHPESHGDTACRVPNWCS